jgi:hypothetical protein
MSAAAVPLATARASWNGEVAGKLLDELRDAIAADGFAAIASWSIGQRRALLAEIETFRRLVVLTGELSEQLSRIALPAQVRRGKLVQREATVSRSANAAGLD